MEYGTEGRSFCMTGGEEAAFDRPLCHSGHGGAGRLRAADAACGRKPSLRPAARGRFAETAVRPQSILFPETAVRRGGSGGYPESGRSPHCIAARRNPTEWEPRRTFEHKNRKERLSLRVGLRGLFGLSRRFFGTAMQAAGIAAGSAFSAPALSFDCCHSLRCALCTALVRKQPRIRARRPADRSVFMRSVYQKRGPVQ